MTLNGVLANSQCADYFFSVLLLFCATLGPLPNVTDATGAPSLVVDFGDQDQFFFGLATAPAHVEDNLHDAWLDFARSGGVAAWKNHPVPEDRVAFWTKPEQEIDLAARTGVTVFRMGVDWSRLVPAQGRTVDQQALNRYRQIMDYVRSRGMRVMLTLFHHSLPPWAIALGGWTNAEVSAAFLEFARVVVRQLQDQVDLWIVHNEPAVFAALTHVSGMWPGGKENPLGLVMIPGVIKGDFFRAMDQLTATHKSMYEFIHQVDSKIADQAWGETQAARVGVAHNIGHYLASRLIDVPAVLFTRQVLNYKFIDEVVDYLDFLGLNYYGSELVRGSSVDLNSPAELSESGRVVNPRGLYKLMVDLHQRYNIERVNRRRAGELPFIITENGISDSTDILRPAYMIEHLRAIRAAMDEGVPIKGYIFWTVSDNWEWADGYCPKFGLVSVDRYRDLARSLRPSFHLFAKIVAQGGVSAHQLDWAWQRVAKHQGKERPFCRALDGRTGLDEPGSRPFAQLNWRFRPEPILIFQNGSPYDPKGLDFAPLRNRLRLFQPSIRSSVEELVSFFQLFNHLDLVVQKDGIQFSLFPKTYIACTLEIQGFAAILNFNTQFAFRNLRREDSWWVADVQGVYLASPNNFIRDIGVFKVIFKDSLLDFEFEAPLLNWTAPIDLRGVPDWKCSIRDKGPGFIDFY